MDSVMILNVERKEGKKKKNKDNTDDSKSMRKRNCLTEERSKKKLRMDGIQ